MDGFARKAKRAFGIATAAATAYAIKLSKDSVQAAQDDIKEQILLTTTLKNVTNATEIQIAAVQQYIDKTELLTNIQGDELIPSFNQLLVATGDSTKAMLLQSVAIDTAAGTGKDLAAVSAALAKAANGNFTALKKLVPSLDENIIKNKDLGAALTALDKTYGGTAKRLADKDPFGKLAVATEKFKEKIGYALIPALTQLVTHFTEDVIPQLEYWLELNRNGIDQALESAVGNIKEFTKALGNIFDYLKAINQVLPLGVAGYIQLGAAIYGIGKAIAFAGFAIKSYTTFQKANFAANMANKEAVTGLAKLVRESNDITKQGNFVQRAFNKQLVAFLTLAKTHLIIGPKMAYTNAMIAGSLKGLSGAALVANASLKALRATIVGAIKFVARYWKAIAVLIAALKAFDWIHKKITGNDKVTLSAAAQAAENRIAATNKLNDSMDKALNKYKEEQSAIANMTQEEKDRAKQLAAMAAKQLADEKRQAAAEAKRASVLARLAKLQQVPGKGKAKVGKLVPTSTLEAAEQEAINFRAAELLLLKQKDNAEELKRLKALQERIEYQKLVNELSMRYVDILRVLGDQKITDDEIKALSIGWKLPIEAVKAYLIQFQAVSDGKISNDEIENLAKTWGSTKEQAEKYLQFFNYLNDGILSDSEIKKLMTSWGMTEAQVRQYADFVQVVSDGKLDDSEVVKLQEKWKLSIDEVVDYIKKIGSPVAYSGTLIDPAKAAEIGWLNATAALQRYLDLLKAGTGGTITPTNPVVPVVPVIPVTPGGKPEVVTPDGIGSTGGGSSDAAAIAYAVAKAAGDMETAAKAAAQVNPSTLAAGESGAIGAASIAAQLKAAEQQVAYAATLAGFKEKEAADAAAASAATIISDAAQDAAERARFRAMTGTTTAASSISGGNLMAAPVVNITVQGSVTTEQDLVNTVRNGLLGTQYNGNSLLLQAI